jgi:hypothetical protein
VAIEKNMAEISSNVAITWNTKLQQKKVISFSIGPGEVSFISNSFKDWHILQKDYIYKECWW